jgi:hypothetical protein
MIHLLSLRSQMQHLDWLHMTPAVGAFVEIFSIISLEGNLIANFLDSPNSPWFIRISKFNSLKN